ncbi:L-histidine N(alpha)-methyltransferase [Halostreptopolyspora alba]|uniref:Methyltransferase domain-containing protein n=1 Tax=Halostreptopolyspora alba TaxID=2487137 RepID=A0A3N0EG90_9ACTN|nr:methyltransferase domain-containing protein [Nocardiopsaceae bacterium YIM 96095]
MTTAYVHGYTERESRRLSDQAQTLAELLHTGTAPRQGARVLEAGCGTGAQTPYLLEAEPTAHITAVDVSRDSLERARERLDGHPDEERVAFVHADLFDLPFAAGSFDHVFVCFVLEHLAAPVAALATLRHLLRPGGTITAIEGDHASALFHPRSAHAEEAIAALVRVQADAGGDALIGRRLQPLLEKAGFSDVAVEPRTVYADATRPELVQGFVRETFVPMVESARGAALRAGITTPERWRAGIADLEATAADGGTFHYTFFRAGATNPTTAAAQDRNSRT